MGTVLNRWTLAAGGAAIALLLTATWCVQVSLRDPQPRDDSVLPAEILLLSHLHSPLSAPEKGDWLDAHWEPGQTYDAFQLDYRGRVDPRRFVLCVQPLGEFHATRLRIMQLTATFLGICFNCSVRVGEPLPLEPLPESGQRGRANGPPQILTGFILNEVLLPRLSGDAWGLIGCTASDITPGGDWNCVYGQADVAKRVAVWSLYRNGDPDESPAAFRLALLRSLKTASHEVGHLLGMDHCVYFECCMGGANHRAEADRRPLWLCPSCLAKLRHATGTDLATRFRRLADFAHEQGLRAEADFWQKALEQLATSPGKGTEP
jgi:archaemetzincin